MHIDARQLPDNTLIEGDICIVGTGPAGLSIALQWDHTPYKVILLEGGGLDYDDQVQDLYAGQVTGQKYYPLKSTRLHYFGGRYYTVQCHRRWAQPLRGAAHCGQYGAFRFERTHVEYQPFG